MVNALQVTLPPAFGHLFLVHVADVVVVVVVVVVLLIRFFFGCIFLLVPFHSIWFFFGFDESKGAPPFVVSCLFFSINQTA